jgi:hypothetical protein
MHESEKRLTLEIIKRVMGNLGIVSGNKFGLVGVVINDCLTSETIPLEDEDHEISYAKFWSAEADIGTSKLRATVASVGDKEVPSYIVILKADDSPIHALTLDFDDQDTGRFLIQIKSKEEKIRWNETNILIQAQVLIGIEH